MQTNPDRKEYDANFNTITQNCLEALDEFGRLFSHLENERSESVSKNTERFRHLILLYLDFQKKKGWKYMPVNYQKIITGQSEVMAKSLIQSICNIEFVSSYFIKQSQQNLALWNDMVYFWTQNMTGVYGIYFKFQLIGSDFLKPSDKQFLEAIQDAEQAYENYEHAQNTKKTARLIAPKG